MKQSAVADGRRKPTQLETLTLYEDFKAFRKYMYRGIDKMPRWIKNSEGVECMRSIKACVRHLSVVARTYDKRVKIAQIDMFLTEWDAIFDSISFFFDVKGITKHQRDVMLNKRTNIEDQVSVFRSWLSNEIQPRVNGNPKD